jgi:hypothetical protein
MDGGDIEGGTASQTRADRRRPSGFALAVAAAVVGGAAIAVLLRPAGGNLPATGAPSALSTAVAAGQSQTGLDPSPGAASITPQVTAQATRNPANIELPGSPEIVAFQRAGDDLQILGWRPGEAGLGIRHVIRSALEGITDRQDYAAQLSSDGSIVLVQAHAASPDAGATFRAFRLDSADGRRIWDTAALGNGVSASFFAATIVIVASTSPIQTDLRWTVVDLSRDDPVLHELEVPQVPRPAPGTSIDLNALTFNYTPLAISPDHGTIYAMSRHSSEPLLRPAFSLAIATGETRPLDALPTGSALGARSSVLDATSGRLLLAGPYWTAGPGFVEAWTAGKSTPDFKMALTNVFGAIWLDDGGVITADYDKLPGPFTFRIVTLTSTGEPDETLFSGQGTDANFLGVQRGFAAAYLRTEGTGMRTLVVIRLADGAVASVEVPEPSGINHALGLLP